jgi:DNA modification methylase
MIRLHEDGITLLETDVLTGLRNLPDNSVQTVMTSPPYWGLRDYKISPQAWSGDPACRHEFTLTTQTVRTGTGGNWQQANNGPGLASGVDRSRHKGDCRKANETEEQTISTGFCACGAWKGSLGLEPTPELYVEHLVEVFREVRRVLRDDGTLWMNLGDSYASGKGTCFNPGGGENSLSRHKGLKDEQAYPLNRGNKSTLAVSRLKPKDLVGIPWMVAFALRADGWVLRSEIIWNKKNPMPESVTDRPTKAHEQVFLFSKAKWIGPERGRFGYISDEDARWLACCIDTEGCIVVKRVKQNDGGADAFGPQVTFGGTSIPLVERFRQIVGYGNISVRAGKNAPMKYWQLSNNVARDFLYRIYPYLIVKQRQARIGIYVDDLVYHRGGKLPARKQRSKSENDILLSLLVRNTQCNQFGHPNLSDVPHPQYGRWDSQRYFYDAEAIKEPATSNGDYKTPDGWDTSIGDGGHGSFVKGGREKGHTGWLPSAQRPRTHGVNSRMNKDRDPAHGEAEHEKPPVGGIFRNRRSVWEIATQPYREAHFATFPEKLVEPCLLAGSKAGDVVLDPFAGSGTVLSVAYRLHRHAIGIELNPDYCTLAIKRLHDTQKGLF